jgi:hypothetical protein
MSGKNLNGKINRSAAINRIAFVSFSLFVTDLWAAMEKYFLEIKKNPSNYIYYVVIKIKIIESQDELCL